MVYLSEDKALILINFLLCSQERLKRDIEAKAQACSQAIFIFDEIDQMPSQLLDVISFYLDFHMPTSSLPIDFRKTIFIFLRCENKKLISIWMNFKFSSNTGGESINELTATNYGLGIPREKFDILPFQKLLSNTSFYEKGKTQKWNNSFDISRNISLGGFQYALLIERHLVTFFVPFLPLERVHIRDCILQQLKILLKNEQDQYEYFEYDIVDRVLQLMEFTPSSSFEYSKSGCKRVQQKLNYIFEIIRSTVKQKKISVELWYLVFLARFTMFLLLNFWNCLFSRCNEWQTATDRVFKQWSMKKNWGISERMIIVL